MGRPTSLVQTTRSLPAVAELVDDARSYAATSRAANTRRAYAGDLRTFEEWCVLSGVPHLPAQPQHVALYLAHLARSGKKVATLQRALVAISQAHKLAGHESPRSSAAVREVLKGIRRKHGVAQTKKAPLLPEHARQMVEKLPNDLLGTRDRALLLLGLSGGFRRSELVALDLADLQFVPEGVVVTIRRSKTDQEGAGRKVGVPFGSFGQTCPVRSMKRWLELAGSQPGAVFRSVDRWGRVGDRLAGHDVGRVVKRAARAAGLDSDLLGAHSLRAGFVTAAYKAGKSERAIMAQTGHQSERVMRGYYRDADLFTENAAKGIGL